MKVAKVDVNSYDRFPENGEPRSGYVAFDDGKEYAFTVYRESKWFDEHIAFHGSKVMLPDSVMRYRQRFTFRSKKREQALEAWLKENG